MPAVPAGVRGAVITGWGTALPDKVLTNHDLAARGIGTTHEWIVERTGIHQRHVGGTTSGLSIEAGRRAIEMAGVDPASIDLLVLATTTPDRTVPGTAPSVQLGLGLRCGAVDLNAACSGFVYGLIAAHGLIGLGARRALVIGAETLSRITDYDDRGTGILFGDGAAAVVLDGTDGAGQLLGWDVDANGNWERILYAEVGGHLQMDGKEVFRQAVRLMADTAKRAMDAAGVGPEDVALVVPHQANVRIIELSLKSIGIPMERAAMVLHRTGNTSAASIPLALADALEHERVHDGDLVLLVGFGAGMTAASAVLRWGGR